jgi:dolichol-phosphate mannosyltransferase
VVPDVSRVVAVIPAFRAAITLGGVVERALSVVDDVIVVDDACPERCGALLERAGAHPRVHVLRHERNGGVGAAMKTGIVEALALGADIVVKLDADDQMDTNAVPEMIRWLQRNPDVDMVKGNRFADIATLSRMPVVRLIGNAALTFLVKFSSGYWMIVDPTNGFIAIRTRALEESRFASLDDRYFFEIDLLCALGLRRRTIAEMALPAIYGAQTSSLSITHALATFPLKLLLRFCRRIVVNYFIIEINVGSLCALIGLPTLVAAIAFGGHQWRLSLRTEVPRPTGTIILALLLFMIGFQLTLQAILYDVQFSTKTLKIRPTGRTNLDDPDVGAIEASARETHV